MKADQHEEPSVSLLFTRHASLVTYRQPRRVPPQAFEIVKVPSTLQKDMDDETQVIHQDPLRLRVAFDVRGRPSCLLELFLNRVANRLRVPNGSTGADEKITGEGTGSLQVQDAQVQGFPVLSGTNRGLQLRGHHPGYFPPRPLDAWPCARTSEVSRCGP